MYYRRAGDVARSEAAFRLAQQHPFAATRFERIQQTPLVYHHGLRAMPFWPARDFAIVRRLEAAFADPSTRAAIDREVDELVDGGLLGRMLSPVAPLQPGSRAADEAPGGAWSEIALFDGHQRLRPVL